MREKLLIPRELLYVRAILISYHSCHNLPKAYHNRWNIVYRRLCFYRRMYLGVGCHQRFSIIRLVINNHRMIAYPNTSVIFLQGLHHLFRIWCFHFGYSFLIYILWSAGMSLRRVFTQNVIFASSVSNHTCSPFAHLFRADILLVLSVFVAFNSGILTLFLSTYMFSKHVISNIFSIKQNIHILHAWSPATGIRRLISNASSFRINVLSE